MKIEIEVSLLRRVLVQHRQGVSQVTCTCGMLLQPRRGRAPIEVRRATAFAEHVVREIQSALVREVLSS